MTDVYVDLATAALGAQDPTPDPESIRALGFLAESGLRVILVSGDGAASPETVAEQTGVDAAAEWDLVGMVPSRPDARSWYLTSDVAHCQGATARLRTVLIGAAPPSASVRRCDAVARDVQAAVMEILAAEAMPSKL